MRNKLLNYSKIAFVICMLLMIVLMPTICFSSEKIEDMDSSVVRIFVSVSGDYGLGSGVLISESGYVLTNAHVVENALKIMVLSGSGDSYKEHPASVAWINRDSDLALLLAQNIKSSPAIISNAIPSKGSRIYAIGFPTVADEISGNSALIESTLTEGVIGRIYEAPAERENITVKTIQHSAQINPGNSGGGLFDECGHLIGINTALAKSTIEKEGDEYYVRQNSGMGLAVSVSEILLVLAEKQISITSAEDCLDVKKPVQAEEENSVRQSNQPQEKSYILFYVVGLIAFVLALIGIKTALQKKPSGSETHTSWLRRQSPEKHAENEKINSFYVFKGTDQSGNEFLINLSASNKVSLAIPITIGRSRSDSDFSIEDQSISRRHFEVLLKSNRIMIRDLLSTNGTRVNGSKISGQWISIAVGDKIQAGNVSLTLLRN